MAPRKYRRSVDQGATWTDYEQTTPFNDVTTSPYQEVWIQPLGDVVISAATLSLFPPGGLLPKAIADLDNTTTLVQTAGTVTKLAGKVHVAASSSYSIPLGMTINGEHWVAAIVQQSVPGNGSYRHRVLNPTTQGSLVSTGGYRVQKLPGIAGSNTYSFLSGTGFDGDVLGQQIYEMASVLAQPADVYLALGQSLMASTSTSVGVDPLLDVWSDKRCLYFPGAGGTGPIATGVPYALVAPLQTNGTASGVSPAIGAAAEIAKSTPSNRNIVIIQGAQAGTGLVDVDKPWHAPGGSNPTAYNAAVAQINQAMSVLPAGSVIKGVLWAQGESDSQADMSGYPPAFVNLRAALEAAIGSGVLPWFFLLPPPDAGRPFQADLIAVQTQMDQGSGHVNAQTGVYCLARTPGHMEDDTHPTAAGQRIDGPRLGRLVVQKLGLAP